jgi:hypothetical protein
MIDVVFHEFKPLVKLLSSNYLAIAIGEVSVSSWSPLEVLARRHSRQLNSNFAFSKTT